MNRYALLTVALFLAAAGCSEDDPDKTIVNPYTGPVEYEIELGTGGEGDTTGCLQMGTGNGEVVFGASATRVDDEGKLTNTECIISIVLVDGEPYYLAGYRRAVELDDELVPSLISDVEQKAEEGELELTVYEEEEAEGEPSFTGELFINELDDTTAKIAAD